MRYVAAAVVALLALMVCPVVVSAQEDNCPQGMRSHDCDVWLVERMDKRLTEAVAAHIEKNAKLTTYSDIAAEIRRTGQEAHIAWVAFREAECNAQVAAEVMSARPAQDRKASCFLFVTKQRLAEMTKP